MPCLICGKPTNVFNCFGGACDPSHLWFVAVGESREEALAALEAHRKKHMTATLVIDRMQTSGDECLPVSDIVPCEVVNVDSDSNVAVVRLEKGPHDDLTHPVSRIANRGFHALSINIQGQLVKVNLRKFDACEPGFITLTLTKIDTMPEGVP